VVEGKTQYRVKWKDYPIAASSWEPATNLIGCQELIEEFNSVIGEAPAKHKSDKIVPPTLKNVEVAWKMSKDGVKVVKLNKGKEKKRSSYADKTPIEIEDDEPLPK
jgi:hypothetical protein